MTAASVRTAAPQFAEYTSVSVVYHAPTGNLALTQPGTQINPSTYHPARLGNGNLAPTPFSDVVQNGLLEIYNFSSPSPIDATQLVDALRVRITRQNRSAFTDFQYLAIPFWGYTCRI